MVNEYSLFELLKKYDVNPDNIKGYKMDRLITYSEYEEVEHVLKYIRNTLDTKKNTQAKSKGASNDKAFQNSDHINLYEETMNAKTEAIQILSMRESQVKSAESEVSL